MMWSKKSLIPFFLFIGVCGLFFFAGVNKQHAIGEVYCARLGFENLDSARQSQIEAKRSERQSLSLSGKGTEEDLFGKTDQPVAMSDSSEQSACLFAPSDKIAKDCGRGPRQMRVGVRHIEGKGIGYGQGYTSLDLFLGPNLTDCSRFPFLDLRGHVFDNGELAANAGIGFRFLGSKRVWGANVYYDYRNALRMHYNQAGVGLESLGKTWDFRINAYLPLGKTQSSWFHAQFDRFKGNNFYIRRSRDFVMKGVDSEIGAHFAQVGGYDFYIGAGPYYFGAQGKNAWGGKMRISATYKQFFFFEASGSYDNIFEDIGQVQLGFSLPFGPRSSMKKKSGSRNGCRGFNRLENRMVQPVVRQEIIVRDKRHSSLVAIDPATGLPYNILFVDNESHSAGTYESPYHSFEDALTSSTVGDIIYVFPGDGTTNGLDALASTFQLFDNQQILGAATGQSLSTTVGTILIPAQADQMPHFTANSTVPVITLANNNTVSGLHITADGGNTTENFCIGVGDSVSAGTTENFTLSNNFLEANNKADGIFSNSAGVMSIAGNLIHVTPDVSLCSNVGQGININYASGDASTSSYVISGNTITSTLPGICASNIGIQAQVNEGNRTFDIRNNAINIGSTGILINVNGGSINSTTVAATIANNTLSNLSTAISYITSGQFNPVDNVCSIQGNAIQNIEVSGGNGVFVSTDYNTTGTYIIATNTFINAEGGIELRSTTFNDMSMNTVVCQNNWLQNAVSGLQLIPNGISLWMASMTSNMFTNIGTAMDFGGQDSLHDQSVVTCAVENNTIINEGPTSNKGVNLSIEFHSMWTINIASNNFTNCLSSVSLENVNQSAFNAIVENNSIIASPGLSLISNGILVQVNSRASSGSQVQVFSNYTENTGLGIAIEVGSGSPKPQLCLQFLGNQSNTDKFQFINDGTLNLIGTALGNNPVPTVSGTVNQVSSCP